MQPRSQADLEQEMGECWAQVDGGTLSLQQAFGTFEDWIIQLGERKAFLHPNLRQWMWYDRLHDEWVFAGCGMGEAIMLTIGSLGGVKKLPKSESVADWCVYMQDEVLLGPLRTEELRTKIDSQQIPEGTLIWSTRATDWFSADDQKARDILFHQPG